MTRVKNEQWVRKPVRWSVYAGLASSMAHLSAMDGYKALVRSRTNVCDVRPTLNQCFPNSFQVHSPARRTDY